MSDDVPEATASARDYELDDYVHADSPERLKALGDRLRQTILDLVLERAMSVTELSVHLGRPKGSVAYHVDVLVDAGLLQVVRTRKVRAVEERFYGRVARTIVFSHDDDDGEIPFLREVMADIDLDRDKHDAVYEFGFRHVRIPRERAAEYAERLRQLSLEFIDERRGGDVEYGMYLAMFPTNRLNPTDTHPTASTEPS